MPQEWNTEQVLALAPDEAAAKAGKGLARAAQWSELGRADHTLWGAIRGSGKDPYRVRIDLNEPAFKCSCPSRKFPCKHGLGLLLILVEHADAIAPAAPPDWVAEWIAQRAERREARAARAAEPRAVDADAQAKRAAKRQARVEDGIEELTLWLKDVIRQGLANAQTRPLSFWEAMAARLVDAQAPGLARGVKRLAELISSGEGWQARALAALGRLHLLCEAHRRIAELPPDIQTDVRIAVGWNVSKDELLALPRRRDTWCVLAQRVEREEQLRVQRTWLLGLATGQAALVLQFAAGAQGFEHAFRLGAQIETDMLFYPGALPIRAMPAGDRGPVDREPRPLPAAPALVEALDEYSRALARQPWLERWPMRVGGLLPALRGEPERLLFHDERGRVLPVVARCPSPWEFVAISGGAPLDVFGEWDGDALRPLAIETKGRLFTFVQTDNAVILARVA